ncbi:bifunctional tRNA (5-methylaminomethyl-2-thiouridine)(34)-methyltransferase MnmD/FAD-dependent 5-carboxymethylaminomethyl-2-thiouridine(34) oxidoreductase MnmC [Marinobacter sp.]|uniref:bifunctional tRNA (5-methylaminomethyl-2-thiouridine)(34)-methyltransferase MnmD/FAD-dependent 5-carboxymethylaminomethyl-2-thiouridine(34) oxidoreductase MnmC n=1 Tax=Marinobacter sp. TaxID=50741 RepID=UPI00384BA09E
MGMQQIPNHQTPRPAIASAEIAWHQGQPISPRSGDVYFTGDNGLEEARYVFLEQNGLRQRFEAMTTGNSFVIAEAGFGTGLNFLAAWLAWLDAGPENGSVLHFVAVECRPLSHDDLAQACALWPGLEPLSRQLLSQYPSLTSGLHRLSFSGGQVRLSLYFGDAQDALREVPFIADAWFLDESGPGPNPGVRMKDLACAIAEHSRPGTTLSTLAVAPAVREALKDVGFATEKVSGHAQKREILNATWQPGSVETCVPSDSDPGRLVIVGAGVAGALLARNLAERGVKVTVLDAGARPASGASGNLQGALYVKLGVDFNHQSRLALSSLLHSQRFYRHACPDLFHPTGLLQLAWSDEEADRQRRFADRNSYPADVVRAVDREEAAELSGFEVSSGGLWYPNSGWLEPSEVCSSLLDHPGIRLISGFQVTRLMPCNGRWHVSGEGEPEVVCDRVILCAGHATSRLLPVFGAFRFKTIRGQVTSIPEDSLAGPKAVICGSRYLNPPHQGRCLTGATFDLRDPSPDVSLASHLENLDELETNLPGVWKGSAPAAESLSGRVAFRCTTHDYQPVVGPLTDQSGREIGGLDLFTGLGSKGLAYAPLLAEYLADVITGQPQSLPVSLSQRLAPDRCRVQEKRKSA